MLKLVVLILGLVMMLPLVACGGDDDDASENSPGSNATERSDDDGDEDGDGGDDSDFHACSLFTAEEIAAVTEVEMQEGRDYLATADGATQCAWESADSPLVVYIEVLLEDGEDWYDAIHIEGASVDEFQEVEGLGDVAGWDTFLGTLDVVDDDRFVGVQPVLIFSELDSKDVAIELAEMTLERLP